jgi:hypothetical protein
MITLGAALEAFIREHEHRDRIKLATLPQPPELDLMVACPRSPISPTSSLTTAPTAP